MAKKHEEERFLKAIQKDNGIILVMDYGYLKTLKEALNKALKYGYHADDINYSRAIDMSIDLDELRVKKMSKHSNKSIFYALEKENGVIVVMDNGYLEALKEAMDRAFRHGYKNNENDEYLEAIAIDMCLDSIKYDRRAKENAK